MTKGSRIKELRESTGLSQVTLAQKIGVAKQTLYKYENDIITNIPSNKIEEIAKATGVDPSYIMGWEEEKDSAAIPAQRILSPDQEELLSDYDKLNSVGKDKVREYASDLTEQKKYTQDTASSEKKMA